MPSNKDWSLLILQFGCQSECKRWVYLMAMRFEPRLVISRSNVLDRCDHSRPQHCVKFDIICCGVVWLYIHNYVRKMIYFEYNVKCCASYVVLGLWF
jgi:hypothetical protein